MTKMMLDRIDAKKLDLYASIAQSKAEKRAKYQRKSIEERSTVVTE